MATTRQTDFLDLGLYQAGDYISYLGSFNDNMTKVDDFAKNTHATIGGLTEQQGATTADITKINSDISDLQSAQETITNKIADLPQLTSDVATLKVDNTANKANISTLNTSVDNLTTMVNQDGTEISSLDDRVTALEDATILQEGATYTVIANIPSTNNSGALQLPAFITPDNVNDYNVFMEYFIDDSNMSGMTQIIKTEAIPLINFNTTRAIISEGVYLPIRHDTSTSPQTLVIYHIAINNMTIGAINWQLKRIPFNDSSKLYYTRVNCQTGQAMEVSETDMQGHRYQLRVKMTIYHK